MVGRHMLVTALLLAALRAGAAYGGVTMLHEGGLRSEYEARAAGIAAEAGERLAAGDDEAAARWAVEARNQLKGEIRERGNPLVRELAEQRNLAEYGDPLGPSYEGLYAKYEAAGVAAGGIDEEIVAGAGRTNAGVNLAAAGTMIGGALVLAVYGWLVLWRLRRARREHRSFLVAGEATAFVLALPAAAAGVGLLAPLDPLAGSALDTYLLGVAGALLLSTPLVWVSVSLLEGAAVRVGRPRGGSGNVPAKG